MGVLAGGQAAGASSAQATYKFQTLDNSGAATFNQLLGINSFGEIAGYFGSGAAGHPNKGYTLAPPHGASNYTSENYPTSAQTQVTGLNDTGVTVGFYSKTNNATVGTNTNHGFVDVKGTFTTVTAPTANGATSVTQVLGINDSDIAVGFYMHTGKSQGFEYNVATKTFKAIAMPTGATALTATAINNEGAVSGFVNETTVTKAFYMTATGKFTVTPYPTATSTMALGLNDFGEVVGVYKKTGVNHGFTWRPATKSFTAVNDPTATSTTATDGTTVNGVNNAGDLVGFYVTKTGKTNGMLATTTSTGYYTAASDGGMFAFTAPFYGSMGGTHLNEPIVGMATTPDGRGYWLVASDGGVFAFGDAQFYGSMGGKPLNAPVVGIAASPTGRGYDLVAADGGIFSFGDAQFYGSMGGKPLNKPIVGIATDPSTGGYWEVASDGGIFSFNAPFEGAMGGQPLNKPVVGITSTPDGGGYWETASDGGVFSFGDATFYGSEGGKPLNAPIVGIASTAGSGYWFVASDGGIFSYGDAIFHGSMGGKALNAPMVAMAADNMSS